MPDRDEPIASYYPSARVRLIVRLEDFGTPKTPAAPTKPTTLRRGVTSKNDQVLQVETVDGAYLLVGAGSDPDHVGSPQQQHSSSDGLTFALDGIIPNQAGHQRNGIRTADTLSFAIPFADLPLDPRVVRSCAVQYFLGCVSADEYERGLNGVTRAPAPGAAISLPLNVIPDNYVDSAGRSRTNLRFEGWVDEWAIEFPEADAPMLRFECTDNTRLLLDQDAPPGLTVGTDQPLDLAFANYLANFPQFRGLSVVYQPAVDRSKIPVLKQALKATAFQPKLGPAPAGGGTSKLKVWDYLTDVAGSVGHILRFEGTTLIIQTPRTLYNSSLPARTDDPFQGRRLPSGVTLTKRLYLYGANIQEMKYARKYAQFQPFNVEVRSYSTKLKQTLVARYPGKDDRVKRLNPGEAADQKWTVVRVRGIDDPKALRSIAQAAYENIGRRELGVVIVTKNLGSLGGGNLDPDMLDALPGDAIEVAVGAKVQVGNTVLDIGEQMRVRANTFLRELGFSADFALAYQLAATNIGLPTTYRIRTLGSQWDGETEGITLTADCINYVEIRADKSLPDGEEVTAADLAGNLPQPVTVSDSDIGI